ncbi:MAG: hypothetical protein O2820_07755, partial [Planctomycetota bacterium]|nr:hypothetical protein [Planctomycetota bacterium]
PAPDVRVAPRYPQHATRAQPASRHPVNGYGNCNQRQDPDPALMGIVFTIAGDSPAERLPPAFVSRYGW